MQVKRIERKLWVPIRQRMNRLQNDLKEKGQRKEVALLLSSPIVVKDFQTVDFVFKVLWQRVVLPLSLLIITASDSNN